MIFTYFDFWSKSIIDDRDKCLGWRGFHLQSNVISNYLFYSQFYHIYDIKDN